MLTKSHLTLSLFFSCALVVLTALTAEPAPAAPNSEKGPRCSDGIDNDGDGLVDGDDPDCGGDGDGGGGSTTVTMEVTTLPPISDNLNVPNVTFLLIEDNLPIDEDCPPQAAVEFPTKKSFGFAAGDCLEDFDLTVDDIGTLADPPVKRDGNGIGRRVYNPWNPAGRGAVPWRRDGDRADKTGVFALRQCLRSAV